MRVFLYKRTHRLDPDDSGTFGIYCCMGRMQEYSFDAVIGISGISPNPIREGIARRINWIGIGPHTIREGDVGYPILGFEQFIKWEGKGKVFRDLAPKQAKRMYSGYGVRYLMLDSESNPEIRRVLKLASKAKPSSAFLQSTAAKKPKPCKKTIGLSQIKISSKSSCKPNKTWVINNV